MSAKFCIFTGKKGKNTPVSTTEPTMPLPMKQPTSMLKRGQEDDTKYLCEYNIVIMLLQ